MLFSFLKKLVSDSLRNPFLFRVYSVIISFIRSSKIFTFLLFGFYPYSIKRPYWDWTTIVLVTYIRRHIKANSCLLDVGTGYIGLLSMIAKKYNPTIRVTGIDILPEIIETAKSNVQKRKLDIHFLLSDLFENISSKYDFIVFNAPYIDDDSRQRFDLLTDPITLKRLSGGKDGCSVIVRFLSKARAHLNVNGLILLGVNGFYVHKDTLFPYINEHGFSIVECINKRIIHSYVYILRAIP